MCVEGLFGHICDHVHRRLLDLLSFSRVLSHILENQLYLKGEICEFYVSEIFFLGYIISPEVMTMDEAKVAATTDFPTPKNVKDLDFTDFCLRFIWSFSSITNPLTSLFKRGPKCLSWNLATDEAFIRLKTAFTIAPIL